ncbi:MAG: DUF1704 domain-containing protein [Candidatus Nanohaloarchaea archaeon]|nr:DUF1704 domain-containing protein [Candidatus Nanohaloarchaea archaeon]
MAVSQDAVEQLSEHLDLFHYLQPVNAEEERERFFTAVDDGDTYNPSYQYRGFSDGGVCRELLTEIEDAAEGRLEESMAASLRSRLRMIEAIGSDEITERSAAHYGRPDAALVDAARDQFEPPADGGGGEVDAAALQAAFTALFDTLDVSYGCETGDTSIIRNDPQAKRIIVPADKEYGVTAAKRLLVHESTHSVRTVNGMETGELPLIYGTEGYEVAEEGIATFNERDVGVFEDTLPRITARVIAVDAAGQSFSSLYKTMRDLGLDQRTAFIRTYRVKRGLEDTARPGGFIKDHIYFQGCSTLTDDPTLADRLYAGKVAFDAVDSTTGDPRISRKAHLSAYEAATEQLAT